MRSSIQKLKRVRRGFTRRIVDSHFIFFLAATFSCATPRELPDDTPMEWLSATGDDCSSKEAQLCYQKGLALITSNGSTTDRIAGIALLHRACRAQLDDACQTLEHRFKEPKRLSGRIPTYPTGALVKGVQGTIFARCIITEKGSLRDCAVIAPRTKREQEIITNTELGLEILSALSTWRFTPAALDGQTCETEFIYKVRYQIDRSAR
jgi:hypothetical protein